MSSDKSKQNCGNCGFDSRNERHKESYWAEKMDPRLMDEKVGNLQLQLKIYGAQNDRRIADYHASKCQSKGNESKKK